MERRDRTLCGFEMRKGAMVVYVFEGALGDLDQAPRVCYSKIDKYFQDHGFIKCPDEHALYVNIDTNGRFMLVYYVLITLFSQEIMMKYLKILRRLWLKNYTGLI